MKMTPELIVFAMLAGPIALASMGVVLFGSAVRSALCLVFTFFLLAFLYFSLGMEMIAISQVIVYTGAIMVLFIFVIMLLNPQLEKFKKDYKIPLAVGIGGMLFLAVAGQIVPAMLSQYVGPAVWHPGSPEVVGRALFTYYVYPFELISILLVVGVVGSVFLAKRRIS
jgi:NADH-quinone oxidoreductase subunit J